MGPQFDSRKRATNLYFRYSKRIFLNAFSVVEKPRVEFFRIQWIQIILSDFPFSKIFDAEILMISVYSDKK